ncbi:NAD(P)/FAD-dependent oxidoreductase [Silvibacterium dinghuense]|uniref:NADH:ubiquinone reductase (non-electrogenic) n=1 Tax=Silvibacterium dinghuense TaxID=1560006 RepID=A0A4Q1S716_9BACT|nr:NAD(P)/FAD-dependent oxidoreductase [Silvibacterium dinghuense]RXS92788.1 NAD(P)/FAD-dependent oxidoreductase [Silvibacterium dinghuense]GGH17597.1 NADH dehydrogenase [Silvibacterium dinghuense]
MAAEVAGGAPRPRVVVVGAGFAGINAAKQLAKLPVDVTVIDRTNHYTFQPLLYQIALAVLSPADIAQPIRRILSGNTNTEVLMDEVVSIEAPSRRVHLESGAIVAYDYLVLATGSTHSYFSHPEWAELAPGLKQIEDATEIRRRVLLAFELAERQMVETGSHPPLQFVIIGAGPTGVELAGAISDITRLYMAKDFHHIDTKKTKIIILEGSPAVLGMYPTDLQQKAILQLHKLGVEVHTGALVTDLQPGYVIIGEGAQTKRIESVCTLWAAGVKSSPLGRLLAASMGNDSILDRRGCVLVDEHLNPKGHPEIFICGDLAHFEQDGKQVPGVAQPAMQMGRYAAGRIGLLVCDPSAAAQQKGFRYFDKGDMATIGRKMAVARIVWPFRADWSGFMAWATWLTVHIFFLMDFRNRWSVFVNWGYTYLRFRTGARLITGSRDLPGWKTLLEKDAAERSCTDQLS